MNLEKAISIFKGKKSKEQYESVLVASDGSVYYNADQTKLKNHCKSAKLSLYDVLGKKVIYSPTSTKTEK